MKRNELVRELAKRYGGANIYSKYFTDHPKAEIFFHKKTGFSVGLVRQDSGIAYLSDEGELQAKYRIDKPAESES